MSKPIRKTSVFSHEQDEAFQLTMALDLLLHKATPVRGTGIERAALKERVARIAHCIGQADLFANVADRREPYERAFELSRVSFITLALRELGELVHVGLTSPMVIWRVPFPCRSSGTASPWCDCNRR